MKEGIYTLDRIVYNRRDFPFWTSERKKQYPNGLPPAPTPPKAGTPVGYTWKPVSTLNQKKRPWDIRIVGGVGEVGFLRDDGEFIPDYERAPFKWEDIYNAPFELDARGEPRLFTLPLKEAASEEAYEFRSGRLIRGTLKDTGTFVPEVGSVVLDFGTYDPAKDKRRVYNLPGELNRK